MQTVVGLFDHFEDAQKAIRGLRDAGFSKDDIDMIARDTNGQYKKYFDNTKEGQSEDVKQGAGAGAGIGAVLGGLGGLLLGLGALAIPGIGPVLAAGPIVSTLVGAGAGAVAGGIIGALVDLGVPEEHAKAYAEGVRRGGTLVIVHTGDNRAKDAANIMQQYNPVDINSKMQEWQGSQSMSSQNFDENQPLETENMEFNREANVPVTGGDSMDIPVVEEDLVVGKRSVDTGGVRVNSYIREEPVEKNVDLRQEHVNVERRPVNRDATDEDLNAFKEGTVEFTETQEEVVAEKRPRVVEEVHVDKNVDIENQTVRDTVRKQEVNVEQVGGQQTTTQDDFTRFEPSFRQHFDTTYGSQGIDYATYRPAYQYGYNLARDSRFNDYSWAQMEPQIRTAWENRYGQGTWRDASGPVQYAWETARGKRSM